MRNRILVVDDNATNRRVFSEILKDEYRVTEIPDSSKFMEFVDGHSDEIAAVLVDLLMSQDDDCALLKSIQQHEWHDEIPVLVVMGNDSAALETRLLEYGIAECIRKPFDVNLIKLKLKNVISLFAYRNELQETIQQQNQQLKKQNMLLQMQAESLHKRNDNMITVLGALVEYRDLESGEHINRVKAYTGILAYEMMEKFPEYGLTSETINVIVAASPLHDIGKIAIPDQILFKPGKLTHEEFEYMKSHTLIGCEMIESITDTWSETYKKVSMDISHYHHERYDGNGYPERLSGEQIPICAQLVSVADVYDALVHERVYKDAYPKDKAFRMILDGECGVFSPQMMECLQNCREKMEQVS
jgi:putative two-component system response regulator